MCNTTGSDPHPFAVMVSGLSLECNRSVNWIPSGKYLTLTREPQVQRPDQFWEIAEITVKGN